jgi:prepilin-type N-terminal cleavage/methylation domain-containing protein/prepilin-type processing-associated H-X9-DG protein
MSRKRNQSRLSTSPFAFTLIELLVVVAIIALLIAILMPGLKAARAQARAVKCASNTHQVGQAYAVYLAENNAVYPCSYIYANGPNGRYDLNDQPLNKEFGYIHWSWLLYGRGKADPGAFTCPEFDRGGTPRTNPGSEEQDWEEEQVNDRGDRLGGGSTLEDKQAPRMAFTANHAIIPRNKFNPFLSGGPRTNRLVRETEINTSRPVILATELNHNWITAAKIEQGGSQNAYLSKSHRPISPFYHVGYGAGNMIYQAPLNSPGFVYGSPFTGTPETYGLLPYNDIKETPQLILGEVGPEVQVVGRHHPGGDQLGGTANFLYIDGSVQRRTILSTIEKREWGDRFYSITGRNEILGDY